MYHNSSASFFLFGSEYSLTQPPIFLQTNFCFIPHHAWLLVHGCVGSSSRSAQRTPSWTSTSFHSRSFHALYCSCQYGCRYLFRDLIHVIIHYCNCALICQRLHLASFFTMLSKLKQTVFFPIFPILSPWKQAILLSIIPILIHDKTKRIYNHQLTVNR